MKNEPIIPIRDSDPMEHLGLTKREWLAGLAMQGMLSDEMNVRIIGVNAEQVGYRPMELLCKLAVAHADALLAELSKEG